MKQCFKTYQLTLKTVGPVFIGSGKEISKKEYVFLENNKIAVLNISQVYAMFQKIGKGEKYEKYLLGNIREDMNTWLNKENIPLEKIKPYIKYVLDNSDAIIENKRQLQIMENMKDPFGNPYVPGSSLKGMLRTVLLCQDIRENEKKYVREKEALVHDTFSKKRSTRNAFLKSNIENIENECFHTLHRKDTRTKYAVNDCLQGLIVSDSEPVSIENVILCQRIELHTNGLEKRLPVLRECIRPGTDINFTVTVDTSVCQINEQKIMEAIKTFLQVYYSSFSKVFPGVDKLRVNQVFLGGGCGFVSKTIVYPMFRRQEGMKVAKNIFYKTNVPREHMHDKDEKYGASPHILKCTRYKGQLLQMGLCNLRIKEN